PRGARDRPGLRAGARRPREFAGAARPRRRGARPAASRTRARPGLRSSASRLRARRLAQALSATSGGGAAWDVTSPGAGRGRGRRTAPSRMVRRLLSRRPGRVSKPARLERRVHEASYEREGRTMTEGKPRFIWYELLTSDQDAAEAFYRAVVGWKMADAGQPGMRYTILSARDRGMDGLMALPAAAARNGARPGWVGYVGVPDTAAAAQRIADAGSASHRA